MCTCFKKKGIKLVSGKRNTNNVNELQENQIMKSGISRLAKKVRL